MISGPGGFCVRLTWRRGAGAPEEEEEKGGRGTPAMRRIGPRADSAMRAVDTSKRALAARARARAPVKYALPRCRSRAPDRKYRHIDT